MKILTLFYNLIKNKKTRWVSLLGIVLYILSPIDLVPEFPFGPFGAIDDVILALTTLSSIIKVIQNKDDQDPKSKENDEVIEVEPETNSN